MSEKYMRCDDDRVCCYRDSKDSRCMTLYSCYNRKPGKCPFCKEHPDDIGMSESMSMAKMALLEKEIKEKITQWKIRTGRIDPYELR